MTPEEIKYANKRLKQKSLKLLDNVWEKEEMLEQWKYIIMRPLLKKTDASNCNNYRAAALLQNFWVRIEK